MSTDNTDNTPGRATSSPSPSPLQLKTPSLPTEIHLTTDKDFECGDRAASSTFSIASAHLELFRECYGRTYHAFSAHREYLLPNDEREKDRLDMQFHAIHEILGKYFYAPIVENPQDIIDIGTGTGTWAIDVAELHPDATIIGTDLSPIQPTWVPPNVTFELHDCLQYPWGFSRQFDLIHTQLLNGFAIKFWHEFFEECLRNLKPGGWVECHELDLMLQSDDDSIPKNSAVIRWLNLWDEGAGRGFRLTGQELSDMMGRAGLVDVEMKKFKLPIGLWDKAHLNAGMLNLTAVTEHIEGLSTRIFVEKLGMTEEQMKSYTQPAVKEWRRKSFHSYWELYVVFGRKPPN